MKSLPRFVLLIAIFCLPAQARADEPTVLQGQVVDGDDHPQAGVNVFAWHIVRDLRTKSEVPPSASTMTDAQGNWKFPYLDPTKEILMVGACAPGKTFGATSLSVFAVSQSSQKIVIVPTKTIHLHLVDWKNRPVTGGTARLVSVSRLAAGSPPRAASLWNIAVPGLVTKVNAGPDGTLELPFGGDKDTLGVLISAEGYQNATATLSVPEDDGLTVRLAPGAALHGRVVDAAGRPLGGLRLNQLYYGEAVMTEADGTFTMKSMDEAGTYLNLLAEDRVLVPRLLKPARGAAAEVGDIVAVAGGLIMGQATDQKTGKSLEGWIRAGQTDAPKDADAFWETNAFTKGDGKFSFRLPPGTFNLSFTATSSPGLQSVQRTITVTDEKSDTINFSVDLTAKPNREATLPALVPKTGAPQPDAPDYIYGTVLSKDGTPVAGARVTVFQGDQAVRDGRTSANGKFAIGPLRGDMSPGGGNVGGVTTGTVDKPAPKIFVRAEAPGLAPASEVVPLGSDAPVILKMGLFQELRLRMVDSAGKPVAGAKVSVKRLINYLYTPDGPKPMPTPPGGATLPATVSSGADGNVVLSGLPSEGFCEISLEHPDFASIRKTVALPRMTIVEIPLRRPAGIESKVLFGNEVLQGNNFEMRVHSSWLNQLNETGKPGADGRLAVGNLPPASELVDDFLTMTVIPPADKKEVAPGLKLETMKDGQNSNFYLIDTRDPNNPHRWIGYLTAVPRLEEGQVAHQDFVMRPLAHLMGKVSGTKEIPDPANLVVTYRDPNVDNDMMDLDPASVAPDKEGKFEMWIPAGKDVSLEVKPKGKIWDAPLMSVLVKDPVADEEREVAFPPPAATAERNYPSFPFNLRVVGPDGATVPRVRLSYKFAGNQLNNPTSEGTTGLDGLIQTYLGRDPKGDTVEVKSEYLDKPLTFKWDDKAVAQRVILDRIPDQIPPSRGNGRFLRPDQGEAAPTPIAVGDQAPEFKVRQWGRGGPVTLAALRGKTVVVSFGTYGIQGLLPVLEKQPGKIAVIVLLSPNSGNVMDAYNQGMESAYARFGGDLRQKLDSVIVAVGEDSKVMNEWRGYTALSMGARYETALIDPQGRLAATGLWGAQMVAKVSQLAE